MYSGWLAAQCKCLHSNYEFRVNQQTDHRGQGGPLKTIHPETFFDILMGEYLTCGKCFYGIYSYSHREMWSYFSAIIHMQPIIIIFG